LLVASSCLVTKAPGISGQFNTFRRHAILATKNAMLCKKYP
jgi:hypothetical protein